MAQGALVEISAAEVEIQTSVHELPLVLHAASERALLRVDVLDEVLTGTELHEAI